MAPPPPLAYGSLRALAVSTPRHLALNPPPYLGVRSLCGPPARADGGTVPRAASPAAAASAAPVGG